jgi:UDP-2-acetamido-3-amino-2,3-dideoxy-glucuronate N-acetyltransferase
MFSAIEDARCVETQLISDAEADISIYEQGLALPFPVRRVFTVHARGATERGRHAHKQCGQVMVCLAGRCDVTVDDGMDRKTVQLMRPQDALYVPAAIWAEQSYRAPETILMVLCDQLYDEADYIRDYDAFRTWRAECGESGAPA